MRWLLLDKFEVIERGKYARAIKNVTMGEDHIHDLFPGYPVMPNSLIVESLAQTGGVLAGHATDFKEMIILAKVEKATFERMVLPGDQMVLEAEIIEEREEGWRVHCWATVNSEVAADVNILFVNYRPGNGEAPEDNFVFSEQFMSLLRLNAGAQQPSPDR